MKKANRPEVLVNAPLHYAPENELGVVFLFAHVARKLRVRIEEIRPGFPDCIAYQKIGDAEKRIRIEFEFRSRNFKTHRHPAGKCDWLVCWHHNWPDVPTSIRIVELKKYFGLGFKVWIQPAIASEQHKLNHARRLNWAVSQRATPGDLLLMYRCVPEKCIRDIFILVGPLRTGRASWRDGKCYSGSIKRLCTLESPIFLDDLRNHRVLRTSSFVRRNLQGNLHASEYWPYLHEIIIVRNSNLKRTLSRYSPERL